MVHQTQRWQARKDCRSRCMLLTLGLGRCPNRNLPQEVQQHHPPLPVLQETPASRLQNVIHIEKLRKRKENIPSIASSGSRPNNVGVHTTPDTRLVLSTKSMIWQSVLPVCGDKRIPLPICKIFINENYSRSKQLAPTICAYRFLDLVGFAITTQSMLGISVPSVKIAA